MGLVFKRWKKEFLLPLFDGGKFLQNIEMHSERKSNV